MSDLVEVAIKGALLASLQTFAQAQSPVITIAEPNVEFTPPAPGPTARWLMASFLPATTTGIISGPSRHSGLFQIDVMQSPKVGELKPARVAAAIIAHFPIRTRLTRDGFIIQINRPGYLGPLMVDGAWVKLPVRIPYECFA